MKKEGFASALFKALIYSALSAAKLIILRLFFFLSLLVTMKDIMDGIDDILKKRKYKIFRMFRPK
jgi:hypothetical protein